MSSAVSRTRRTYVDWARGVAVLLMIEAHTLDAWTRWSSRTGRPFAYASILGGFAAPLFLWLAGLGVALAAGNLSRRGERGAAVADALARRGLQIFVLAFLFRLQAFIISPGSYPVMIFRVDILNVMGPSIVACALLWGLAAGRTTRLVAVYAGVAAVTAMVTPILRTSAAVDAVPTWVQWYIRPAGDYTTFTLFPWAGFVFAGAGCGVLLEHARDARSERRALISLAVVGGGAIGLGFSTAARPSIYTQSSFWTSSPTYFAIRLGIVMLSVAILAMVAGVLQARGARWLALERLGRSSLFIYWIHVELVYGYATWPLRHRLPLWGTAVAFVLFSALMFGAVVARDRFMDAWRARHLYVAKGVSA